MKKVMNLSNDVLDERELIERVKRGEAAASAWLYRRNVRYLSAICSRYVRGDEDIRDILQEAFLKIFAAFGEFRYEGAGSVRAWMARIVLNETLRFVRQNSRLLFAEQDVETLDRADEEPETASVPTEVIYQLIRELPDGYRAVFNLYVVEGKSHKEIASLLGIKETSSASQLHHAKALLAAKIKEYQRHNSLLP